MAKLTGPLLSQRASGKIGERLTFSERKTGHQARYQKKNTDLNSFDQQRNRDVYRDAYEEWNLMSAAEKQYWKDQAVGRHLTGFNLFIKDYYMNTIRKLATVENIDLTAAGDTLLYTVPTGMKLMLMGTVQRVKTISNPAGDGVIYIVRGSDDFQMLRIYPAGVAEVNQFWWTSFGTEVNSPFKELPAGETVELKVDTPDTSDILTIDVDVIGYLIEA